MTGLLLRTSALSLFWALASSAAAESSNCDGNDAAPTCHAPSSQCSLYMAESSIPNSGLGVYTVPSLNAKDPIIYPDVSISVEDYDVNRRLRHWLQAQQNGNDTGASASETEPKWLMRWYYWDSEGTWALYEADNVKSIVPGIGMLANSHPGLVNADMLAPPTRTAMDLHRAVHPGAGAVTDYHIGFVADVDVSEGSEVFVDYGSDWFEGHPDIGMVPLKDHYEEADLVLETVWEKHKDDLHSPEAEELWGRIQGLPLERLQNAFPDDIEDIKRVLDAGGTASYSTPDRIRSVEWLQEHGTCLDNLQPGPSTIEGAGQGAFATRPLVAGTVIAPLPVVQLFRKYMGVYDSADLDDPAQPVEKIGDQLLLNYCYGDPDSSVLLFPYSPVVNYLNHHSKPNAVIRWSSRYSRTDMLEMTPEQIEAEHNDHAGLVLELVATADIAAGEEVFIDYGPAWEAAWKEHVEKFAPTPTDEAYISATKLSTMNVDFKTELDRYQGDPYPSKTVQHVCVYGKLEEQIGSKHGLPKYQWEPPKNKKKLQWWDNLDYAKTCYLIEEEKTAGDFSFFTVQLKDKNRQVLVEGIPSDAIRFFDKSYSTDMFQRDGKAFRHAIGLPADVVPKAWKDL